MNAFRALKSNKAGEPEMALVNNFRPPQPVNDRIVTTNIVNVASLTPTAGQTGNQ